MISKSEYVEFVEETIKVFEQLSKHEKELPRIKSVSNKEFCRFIKLICRRLDDRYTIAKQIADARKQKFFHINKNIPFSEVELPDAQFYYRYAFKYSNPLKVDEATLKQASYRITALSKDKKRKV